MLSQDYTSPAGESAIPLARRPCPVLGAILIESGRLAEEATFPILRMQEQEGCLFGEAAIKLGFLAEADLQQALAKQFDYDLVDNGSTLHPDIIAAHRPFSSQVEVLRRLRTVLSAQLFDCAPEFPTLAISSPEPKEGRSLLAANLAVLFAQIGKRTLLIDADFRNSSQHRLFGLSDRVGLSNILAARSSIDVLQSVSGIKGLTVLTAGIPPPNPNELLGRPLFPLVLSELGRQFDVILIDTPAHTLYSDVQLIARHARHALIVARHNISLATSLQGLKADLEKANAHVVGSVMNKF